MLPHGALKRRRTTPKGQWLASSTAPEKTRLVLICGCLLSTVMAMVIVTCLHQSWAHAHETSLMLAPSNVSRPRSCSERSVEYLSSNGTEGFYVLCFTRHMSSKPNISYHVQSYATAGHPLKSFLVTIDTTNTKPEDTADDPRDALHAISLILPQAQGPAKDGLRLGLETAWEVLAQHPQWALYDAGGHLVQSAAWASLDMAILITGGNWVWPGVQIGHERHLADDAMPGGAVELRTLSLSPLVIEVSEFITEEEYTHIMELAEPRLKPSTILGESVDAQKRVSETAWLASELSTMLDRLDHRVSRLLRIDTSHQEHVQVLRYHEGGFFKHHHDYYGSGGEVATKNRHATLLWYMNEVTSGGETIFPHAQPDDLPPHGPLTVP